MKTFKLYFEGKAGRSRIITPRAPYDRELQVIVPYFLLCYNKFKYEWFTVQKITKEDFMRYPIINTRYKKLYTDPRGTHARGVTGWNIWEWSNRKSTPLKRMAAAGWILIHLIDDLNLGVKLPLRISK